MKNLGKNLSLQAMIQAHSGSEFGCQVTLLG